MEKEDRYEEPGAKKIVVSRLHICPEWLSMPDFIGRRTVRRRTRRTHLRSRNGKNPVQFETGALVLRAV